jgi:hypothetical protein
MGKRIELNPGWLVGLLARWALRDTPGRELGYASGCGWMRGFKSSPATAIVDPTSFSADDFGDIEAGMIWLHEAYQPAWAAVMMYYKPWTIQALQAEGFPFGAGNKTYYNRLHDGHARLASRLDEMKEMRCRDLQKLGVAPIRQAVVDEID